MAVVTSGFFNNVLPENSTDSRGQVFVCQHMADQSGMEARYLVVSLQNLPGGAPRQSQGSCLIIEGHETSATKSHSDLPDLFPLSEGRLPGIGIGR